MRRKFYLFILLFCFLGILFFYFYIQMKASAQSSDINEKLKGMGLPIISAKTTSLIPYRIEVDLQSTSTTSDLAYGDIWNMALINHVVADNFRTGKAVAGYSLNLLNSKGENIFSDEKNLNNGGLSPNFGNPTLDNTSAGVIFRNNLEFGNFSIAKIEVSSLDAISDPGQILEIDLLAKDQNDASQSLSTFSSSLEQILYNEQSTYGTYIVLCHVIIRDEGGNILGESVEDVENGVTTGKGLNLGHPSVVLPYTPQPTITPPNASMNTSSTLTPTPGSATGYPPPAGTATPQPYP